MYKAIFTYTATTAPQLVTFNRVAPFGLDYATLIIDSVTLTTIETTRLLTVSPNAGLVNGQEITFSEMVVYYSSLDVAYHYDVPLPMGFTYSVSAGPQSMFLAPTIEIRNGAATVTSGGDEGGFPGL